MGDKIAYICVFAQLLPALVPARCLVRASWAQDMVNQGVRDVARNFVNAVRDGKDYRMPADMKQPWMPPMSQDVRAFRCQLCGVLRSVAECVGWVGVRTRPR